MSDLQSNLTEAADSIRDATLQAAELAEKSESLAKDKTNLQSALDECDRLRHVQYSELSGQVLAATNEAAMWKRQAEEKDAAILELRGQITQLDTERDTLLGQVSLLKTEVVDLNTRLAALEPVEPSEPPPVEPPDITPTATVIAYERGKVYDITETLQLASDTVIADSGVLTDPRPILRWKPAVNPNARPAIIAIGKGAKNVTIRNVVLEGPATGDVPDGIRIGGDGHTLENVHVHRCYDAINANESPTNLTLTQITTGWLGGYGIWCQGRTWRGKDCQIGPTNREAAIRMAYAEDIEFDGGKIEQDARINGAIRISDACRGVRFKNLQVEGQIGVGSFGGSVGLEKEIARLMRIEGWTKAQAQEHIRTTETQAINGVLFENLTGRNSIHVGVGAHNVFIKDCKPTRPAGKAVALLGPDPDFPARTTSGVIIQGMELTCTGPDVRLLEVTNSPSVGFTWPADEPQIVGALELRSAKIIDTVPRTGVVVRIDGQTDAALFPGWRDKLPPGAKVSIGGNVSAI